jgi:RNA polymerase sigma-70 factor (ECF subfamily)
VTERDLIARVQRGDAVAERELYDRHVDRIYRLAFRMTGDDALAQDITQDTFIRAFARMSSFRGDSAVGTWLYAIGTSVALNALRKVKRLNQRETDLEHGSHVGVPAVEPDPDLKERLRRAIDALPLKYRTVFIMHDIEGYKHNEIAEALGIRVGTSKAQLSRGRAKLRLALVAVAPECAQ